MDARTVQNPEEMVDVLWMFFVRNIMRSLVGTNKRSATDVYRLLQVVKDDPTKLALVMGVLDGTHRIVEVGKPVAIDLTGFFTNRPGLVVSEALFYDRILAPALKMPETNRASVGKPYDLPRGMTDAEIHKELRGSHVFEDARAFLVYLAGALELQWGGTDGGLLSNNGHANIFYVRGLSGELFAVFVFWRVGRRRWHVRVDRLDDLRWVAGSRAFPCN